MLQALKRLVLMAHSVLGTSDLRASLQRMQRYLRDALKDDVGANVFEEILRHLDPLLADLHGNNPPDESARRRASALGAQLEASEQARVLAMTDDLEREVKVLKPLLKVYLESGS